LGVSGNRLYRGGDLVRNQLKITERSLYYSDFEDRVHNNPWFAVIPDIIKRFKVNNLLTNEKITCNPVNYYIRKYTYLPDSRIL